MAFTHLFAIDDGLIAADVARLLEPAHAGLDRGLGQSDLRAERSHRQSTVGRERGDDVAVDAVQMVQTIHSGRPIGSRRMPISIQSTREVNMFGPVRGAPCAIFGRLLETPSGT
jgi:hypothetical protein